MKLHVWSVTTIFGVTLVGLSYSPAFPFVCPQPFVRGDRGNDTGIESSRPVHFTGSISLSVKWRKYPLPPQAFLMI